MSIIICGDKSNSGPMVYFYFLKHGGEGRVIRGSNLHNCTLSWWANWLKLA